MNTRAITEGALMATLTVILALIAYYVPFFAVFTYFLMPLPTTVLYARHGLIPAAGSGIIASLLLLIFMDPLNAGLYGADILLPGLLIGYGYYSQKSGGMRVLLGYFAFLGALALEMVLFQYITGVSYLDDFLNQINSYTDILMDSYQKSGMLTGENGQTLKDSITQLSTTVKMMFPAMILIIPALISWTAVMIDDFFFRRFKIPYKPLEQITQWKIPTTAKNILAVVFLVSIVLRYVFQSDPVLSVYPYTFELLCYFVYMVMGFAFIFWLIQKRFGTKFTWLRICILICCLVFTNLLSLVVLIGLIDLCFDIRRFFEKREIQ